MTEIKLVVLMCLLYYVDGSQYCSSDPCVVNNTVSLTTEGRTANCPNINECDAFITPRWYRSLIPMYNECPGLSTCGTVFPVWLNGTEPSVSDGIVDRYACLVGPEGCCHKTYQIKLKNCTSYMAYCLQHLSSCPERYCFGSDGVCPTTTVPPSTTTKVSVLSTTSVGSTSGKGSKNKGTEEEEEEDYHYPSMNEEDLIAFVAVTVVILVISMCVGGLVYRRYHSRRDQDMQLETVYRRF